MVASMAPRPIIFAMANPDPEIKPELVHEVRDDALMATGRSDYPNQVNNVLGFPYIFRGALDVRARAINDEMKIAAVSALAVSAGRGSTSTRSGRSRRTRLAVRPPGLRSLRAVSAGGCTVRPPYPCADPVGRARGHRHYVNVQG